MSRKGGDNTTKDGKPDLKVVKGGKSDDAGKSGFDRFVDDLKADRDSWDHD